MHGATPAGVHQAARQAERGANGDAQPRRAELARAQPPLGDRVAGAAGRARRAPARARHFNAQSHGGLRELFGGRRRRQKSSAGLGAAAGFARARPRPPRRQAKRRQRRRRRRRRPGRQERAGFGGWRERPQLRGGGSGRGAGRVRGRRRQAPPFQERHRRGQHPARLRAGPRGEDGHARSSRRKSPEERGETSLPRERLLLALTYMLFLRRSSAPWSFAGVRRRAVV
jgi:hypothetical protein